MPFWGPHAESGLVCVCVSACQCAGVVTAHARACDGVGRKWLRSRGPQLAESWGLKRKREPGDQGIFPTQDQSQVSHIAGRFFTNWATREAPDLSFYCLMCQL